MRTIKTKILSILTIVMMLVVSTFSFNIKTYASEQKPDALIGGCAHSEGSWYQSLTEVVEGERHNGDYHETYISYDIYNVYCCLYCGQEFKRTYIGRSAPEAKYTALVLCDTMNIYCDRCGNLTYDINQYECPMCSYKIWKKGNVYNYHSIGCPLS